MTSEENILEEEKPDRSKSSTALAVDRTVMAADRSLMAWVRTGLSLISFGFTIYKFLEYSNEQIQSSGKTLSGISSPKVIGLFMIGMGILSLVLGTVENVMTIKGLQGEFEIRRPRYSLYMSTIVALFGIVIFLGIILKIQGIV